MQNNMLTLLEFAENHWQRNKYAKLPGYKNFIFLNVTSLCRMKTSLQINFES